MLEFVERLRRRRTIKQARVELLGMGIDMSGKTDQEVEQMLIEFAEAVVKMVEPLKVTMGQMTEAMRKVAEAIKGVKDA